MKKLKILYLCHRIPYPPNKGDKIRSFHQVRFLAEQADIDLITLADDPADLAHRTALAKMCRRVAVFPLNRLSATLRGGWQLLRGRSISQGYFYHPDFEQTVDEWTSSESYHAIVCFSSPMAGYVMKKTGEIPSSTRLIMDFCDLDSDKWLQYSRKSPFPMSAVYRVEGRRLLAFEKQVSKAFLHSLFVSAAEAELFKKVFPGAGGVSVVPNGVDFDYFDPSRVTAVETKNRPMLMFSGAMDYYANVEGVCWFAREILPGIRRKFPGAGFCIVGSNPDPRVTALAREPGVTVTGFVDDIRQYYKSADICVVPLGIARGVQNKVLEAMSMEKAVVSTSVAIQGNRAVSGRDLVVADGAEEFSDAVIDLLNNRPEAERYGIAARGYVREHHDWQRILERSYLPLFFNDQRRKFQ